MFAKALNFFVSLLVVVTMISPNTVYGEEVRTDSKGVIIQNTYGEFSKGIMTDTEVVDKGKGFIELKKGKNGVYPKKGTYQSPDFVVNPFEYMVLSWNTDTPSGTSVKIETQIQVNGEWSKWLLVATWSSSMDKASAVYESAQSRDDIAYVNTDVITVRGSNGETANKYRYRLTLNTNDTAYTPSVRLVSATFRNTLEKKESASDTKLDEFTGTLDVKPYSQLLRDPQFNNIICSAVSTAMVLDYKGVHILPEMAAMGVLDSNYDGYGNWSFNTAFIGSYGFESYVEYCGGINDIKRELMAGNPVICSVRYKKSEEIEGNLPIISNAPIDRTYGHLVAVIGYEKDKDGKSYVVVNDPTAENDEDTQRRYEESEFMKAWEASGKVAYKVHDKQKDAGTAAPEIKNAYLLGTDVTKELEGVTYRAYILLDRDQRFISTSKAVHPHEPDSEAGVSIVVWDDEKEAVHSYVPPSLDTEVWLREAQTDKTIYIFLKSGQYYKALVISE